MTWIKQHMLIFLGVIIVVVGVVWYGLTASNAPEPLLTTDAPIGGTLAETSADQEIVASLLALRAVSLSGTIFFDPAFMTLLDFSTPLVPEPWGRENPFAPLRGATPAAGPGGAGSGR